MIAANPHAVSVAARQSRRWPAIIIGLLVGHFVLMMTAVFVITRGNHDGLVRDDSRAINSSLTHARSDQAVRLP